MIITRNKLITSILAFLLIVNILVIFNLDYFYIRAILAFIFLITIPGLLLMLCFKIRNIGFWEYLVYTIGLSVAFIMFAGLAVNWILPWMHITSKPLSLCPILICFDIFIFILMLIASKRNKDLKFEPKFPKFTLLDRIFIIFPMIFPVLSILGAFLLNNHGLNILTMIMLAEIAIYVFLLVAVHKKINENVFVWAILMISISLLLSGWLRSEYVSGVDINREYAIFQLTKEKASWSLSNFRDAYNAMLSVTILPTILSLFLKVNDNFILKLFYPLIFMFVPLIAYLIPKKYFEVTFCFLASFFFMSQQAFIIWMDIPIRQQIAFLFFGMMFLVLFSKEINPKLKKALFLIFGFSMIVSHYSTSYLALAIVLFACILIFLYRLKEKRKIKKREFLPEKREEFYIGIGMVLFLFIFAFFWYAIVTDVSEGFIDFMHESSSNLGNIFNKEAQAEGRFFLDNFAIFNKQKNYIREFQKYSDEAIAKYSTSLYDLEKYADYNSNLKIPKGIPYKASAQIISILSYIEESMKLLVGKIFIFIGVIYLFFVLKKYKINWEYMIITISSLSVLCLMVILPFTTISYDLMRTYEQILILLSIPAVFGIWFVFSFLKEGPRLFCTLFVLLIYFLFLSGFISQMTGGFGLSMSLGNVGIDYSLLYSHKSEVLSGEWLKSQGNYLERVYIDSRGEFRLYLSTLQLRLLTDVLPSVINAHDYVYSSYANTNEQITFKSFKGSILSFNYPTRFLNENKNKVYSNGGSEIFK